MRVSAIRVGVDLWRLLEAEAALVGVSVSQYVREAALARACAAAAARGEDPIELLARVVPGATNRTRGEEVSAASQRAREASQAGRLEAVAVRAQSKQAKTRGRRVRAEVEKTGRGKS